MAIAAEIPEARLAGDLFAAIQRREWGQLDRLTHPDLTVEVHARPGISFTRNEHVWRRRRLEGREELHAYLLELVLAAPALAMQPLAASRGRDFAVVRADCAGVDGAGSPFAAVTDFTVWTVDGRVHRLMAEISDLHVGVDVIRQGEGDPRRYFKAFLEGDR